MSSWFMGYFGARKDPKQETRDTIIALRQQLQMIEKKDDHLQKKIGEELRKAKANAVSNKAVATAALRRKKQYEGELDKLSGVRLQLETQISTLESANLNVETVMVMKRGADVLKGIHNGMTMDQVDSTMAAISEQREIANEISEAISNPLNAGIDLDEDELKDELAELEQETLNERLADVEHVPVHTPVGAVKQPATKTAEEDEEEAELRALQASLAM